MTNLITTPLVRLDADLGTDKHDVIRALAGIVGEAGRATDVQQLVDDALARESTSPTGLPGGIAIPHCRTAGVDEPTLAFARLRPPVDFGAKDGEADLAFLIAAPAGGDATHLQLLTKLARSLVKPAFTDSLRAAETAEEVVELINQALDVPAPAQAAPPAPAAAAVGATPVAASAAATQSADAAPAATAVPAAGRSLVAVTACPTGIAHTYMAAEALEAAAERAGVDISVETQGSAGSTPLSHDTIAAASAVIFAVDVGVRDRHRFAGKPMVTSGVKRPIDDADTMISEALRYADDPNAPRVEGTAGAAQTGAAGSESWGGRIRRVLMTGVSYMIPFVAAGGLLIALGFLFGGYEIANHADAVLADSTLFNPPNLADFQDPALDHAMFDSAFLAYFGAVLFKIGALAFSFLVPALAGYIAYAIADRPGIAPGFVMGAVAGFINSGFLGGIIGGVLAGLAAHWVASWKVPTWGRGLMPVLVIPLLATLISGFVMIVVLGKPLASLMSNLSDGLNSLQGGSAVVLGIVLGLMMAFDMGGPLNKTAYAFATAGLGAAATATDAPELRVMAAVMLAGMVPPLALALATVVRPGLFNAAERENGKAAWLMGASFITEGAIPFAAADPLRVIPSIMAGSAVTGALAMGLDVSLRAPHGGIFVLFAVSNILGFLIALVAGTLVSAALVVGLKSMAPSDADVAIV
ncbi:PTS lactose transporter subunit IIC [Nocardioides gansuensis]|uniref:PTS lactose transporter subunit IIC n=1 Tax=Nocardioides gansuensis TaxID=2138300 RepID=A0A2T8FAI3_9ACTN|nr:fructose-specific PTS transporter subunit EIIC [Nocardioides gansuensis]PVG82697.1 PTS lactose transporter subunit IIC [Nocardioides gansuensis]